MYSDEPHHARCQTMTLFPVTQFVTRNEAHYK